MLLRKMGMTHLRKKTTHEQRGSMPFLFVGEALALDLTNTDILLRGKKKDLLATVQDTERWWREAGIHHPGRNNVTGEAEITQWNEVLLTHLKHLRGALRGLFTAMIERRPAESSDLEELNRVLSMGYQSLAPGAEGKLTATYRTTEPAYGAVLLPIALSALPILTQGESARLHRCANERCTGLFYDTTRSATRQWCSTVCMNRARSLHHYRQAKARKARPAALPHRAS